MENSWGQRSLNHRKQCHVDLQKILDLTLKRSAVDFFLYESARTIATQRKYFKEGASGINPDAYTSESALCAVAKHIVIPEHPFYELSRAVDLGVAEKHNDKKLTFNAIHLSYIAGVMKSVAQELYDSGEIEHIIRWGGDWDNDGVIALDQKLKDLVHFELIKP